MIIEVKYLNKNVGKIVQAHEGEWYDLRAAEGMIICENESAMINLGVSMKLPEGYEAIVAPRSSTFKNYGIIETNGIGVIDNAYCGDDDIWMMPVYCLKGMQTGKNGVKFSIINEGDRVAQFRILKRETGVLLKEVEHLSDESRGGLGSTGVR